MQYILLIITIIAAMCQFADCGKYVGNNRCSTGPVFVFKLKDTSYVGLLRIYIDTTDGTIRTPSPDMKMINGYWVNTHRTNAVTSVLYKDVQGKVFSKGYRDSLKQKIIDWHPFMELYEVCGCIDMYRQGDSIAIYNTIINNQLKQCGRLQPL